MYESGQPNNQNSNGFDEDAVLIIGDSDASNGGFWADEAINDHFKFVCIYNLTSMTNLA